jgi:large subunit ribosomal protein L2
MAIKTKRPVTPAQRGMTTADFDAITTRKPLKRLLSSKIQRAGRNNQGRITTRHRGGGVKRHYRIVSFSLPVDTVATIEHIEYDPNRSAYLARVKTATGDDHYILAAGGMTQGQTVHCGEEAPIKTGNRLPLSAMPLGSVIHNVELHPGKGGQIVRSAGNSAQLVAKEGAWAQIKLPSGETRKVDQRCYASLGAVGNEQHQNVKLGSAGRRRRQGRRPHVRGMVMNPVDHPHGGGEGKGKGGNDPTTPWGQPTLGFKTRRRKSTDKYIVRSRHNAKRRKS